MSIYFFKVWQKFQPICQLLYLAVRNRAIFPYSLQFCQISRIGCQERYTFIIKNKKSGQQYCRDQIFPFKKILYELLFLRKITCSVPCSLMSYSLNLLRTETPPPATAIPIAAVAIDVPPKAAAVAAKAAVPPTTPDTPPVAGDAITAAAAIPIAPIATPQATTPVAFILITTFFIGPFISI